MQIIPHKGTIVTPINCTLPTTALIYQRVAVESILFRDFVKVCTPPRLSRSRYRLRMLEEAGAKRHEPGPLISMIFLHRDLAMHEIWFRSTDKMYLWEQLIKPDADYSRFIRLDIVGGQERAGCAGEPSGDDADYRYEESGCNRNLMMQHLWGIQAAGREDFSRTSTGSILNNGIVLLRGGRSGLDGNGFCRGGERIGWKSRGLARSSVLLFVQQWLLAKPGKR